MKTLFFAALLAAALDLSACSSRPPWADGRLVTERVSGQIETQDLSELPARILALHNGERRRVGAPDLEWDESLAASAGPFASHLARIGRLQHSDVAGRPGQGENLWLGTRRAYSVEEMVGGWAAERALFRPGTFPAVSSSGEWSDVGHYTQMVWPSTTRVGCAVRSSIEWDVLVCRYAPAGNVVGMRIP